MDNDTEENQKQTNDKLNAIALIVTFIIFGFLL